MIDNILCEFYDTQRGNIFKANLNPTIVPSIGDEFICDVGKAIKHLKIKRKIFDTVNSIIVFHVEVL